MFDRPIVAFDIETIPDPDVGRRAQGIAGTDLEVVHEMVRRRLAETEGSTEYPQLPWHRVVCVCATILDPARRTVELRHLGGEALDEKRHLEGFYRLVGQELSSPRIVSWNGGGFDLPVMRYRAMVHGVAAPDFYRTDDDRRFANYQSRCHDLHVDVMDVLSGYGAAMRAGLGTMGELLGLPGKRFLERAIYDHVLDGEAAFVVEYCKLDTVETLLVFLVWAFHAGHLSKPDLVATVDAVRQAIEHEPFDGWRDVARSLETWPRWAR
jgi:predicted PolB exonuclease-like 3'-5' exonuclease